MSEADRDAILKELHNSDSEGSDDDEDLGLEIAKMKAKAPVSPEKPKPSENPLDEEEKRHKDNLMQDIYDNISDEDEEESKQSDNPFKEQMI